VSEEKLDRLMAEKRGDTKPRECARCAELEAELRLTKELSEDRRVRVEGSLLIAQIHREENAALKAAARALLDSIDAHSMGGVVTDPDSEEKALEELLK